MPKTDTRVDAYIAKSADFAKPILVHLRKLAHAACPEVEETIKWQMPHFLHKEILFAMAAFKEHCAMHFWKCDLVLGKQARRTEGGGMGHFGRITAISDLPGEKVLLGYIRKAVELNEAGVKKDKPKLKPARKLVVPDYFKAALNKNAKARATFENFPPSHKMEYIGWITEAKREETRAKRMETTLQWLEKGKLRNWKYLNC